jgi:hypothetical protein
MHLLHLGNKSHIFSNPDKPLFIRLEIKTRSVWFNKGVTLAFRKNFAKKKKIGPYL